MRNVAKLISKAKRERIVGARASMSTITKLNRVGPYPFPKSDPSARRKDFSEVALSFTVEQVMLEADRCARCVNPVCIEVCPVQLDVRGMCDSVAKGDFRTAFARNPGDEPPPRGDR